jgi:hypothetical protein
MAEIAVAALAHKTPIVRQSTQQFLTKCFAMATQTTLPKKVLKIYLPALVKVYYLNLVQLNFEKFLVFEILEYRRSRCRCT